VEDPPMRKLGGKQRFVYLLKMLPWIAALAVLGLLISGHLCQSVGIDYRWIESWVGVVFGVVFGVMIGVGLGGAGGGWLVWEGAEGGGGSVWRPPCFSAWDPAWGEPWWPPAWQEL